VPVGIERCRRGLLVPETLRGATILNVDDDPRARYLVSRILERAGAMVVEAGSGEAALEAAAQQTVDIVLLDVNLPGIGGFEVARRLKADPATAGILILHVSGSAIGDESVVRGLEGGADGYLTTPVAPEVLLSTTRALLRMRRATQEAERRAEEAEAGREALRESEAVLERYRLLFQHAHDAILFIRRDGRIIDANAAAEQAYGYPREELCALTIRDLRAVETRYKVEEQMRAANGEGLVFETLHRRRDGSAFPVEVSSRGTDLGGERVLLSIIRDITERKQAEEERERLLAEVRSQERLLDTLVERTDVWLAYLDPENRLVWANSAFASAVGAEREEIIGRPLEEVLPADGTLARLLRRAESTGEPARLHAIPKRLRGARRNLDLAALPVRDQSGAAQGTVFSARDVTLQVQVQIRMLAAERARAMLAETLNAEISHRTKNNLTMVASILQMQAEEEREERAATLLTNAATRLIAFASIHEQLQTTQRGEVDLLATMRRIAEATREIFAAQEVEFEVEGEPVALPSRAATNLAVVANELITNAAKHSGAGPDGVCRVRARLDAEGGTLRLTVWNSGGNVPPGFDVRTHARLGLRLVTALIVDQYGGKFTLRSDDDGTVAEARVGLASLG
jgi:PAS domain S-box-containing protein